MAMDVRHHSISRRNALALTAAGLVPALAGAVTAADPIFAAIDRHRVADAKHVAACNAMQDRTTEQAANEAGDDCHDALRVLAMTVPSTAAGLAAVMGYEREYSGRGYDLFPGRDACCIERAAFLLSIEKAARQLAGLPAPDATVEVGS